MQEVVAFVGKVLAAALAEGEERFRALADQSPFAIWVIDPEAGLSFVNVAYCEFCGLSEAEALGTNWRALLHPEDSERYAAELLTALQERREFVCEVRVRHASGEWRWVESHAEPRFSASGEFLGMVGSSPDITARKQGGASVLASEEKYRSLFENMAEEVHFWQLVRDETGQIETWRLVDANPPTLQTWGRDSVEEIRGKTTDEIFGPGATEHYLPVVRKIFSEGVSHTYEDYFPHLDKHFRFTSVPFGEFFITTGADITEIKKANEALRVSEERFRVLFEGHGAAMLLIEPESGQILDANAAATRFYGYSREQLQAMRIQQINQLPPEQVAAERRKAVDHTKSMFVFPHRLASGEIRFVEVYSSSVTIQDRPTLFSIIHDVTEREQAEQALRESEAERTVQQERARLARDLHDSVSQAIFAAALKAEAMDIAAECDDDRTGLEARQVCRLCKGALADLRAMLLELRGERLGDIQLDLLLRQCVEATEGRTNAQISLAVRGSSPLPVDVHVVFYRVAQEALNNVARHAKAEHAWVEVEFSDASGSLEVRDDGRGFALQEFGVEHLGIRTMRERAAEVGADLDLTSVEGGGTCVILRWPTRESVGD